MRFLITDLQIQLDGHRLGFINNLMAYAATSTPQHEYLFITNRSQDFTLESPAPHIRVQTLKQAEQQEIDAENKAVKKAHIEWEIICAYARAYQADRVIFMYLDSYQLEIGRNQDLPFKISGIWFSPYSRMEAESDELKDRFQNFITKTRKKFVMRWALKNPQLDKIFILNDEEMPKWLNKDTPRFFTLADPYFEYPALPGYSLRKTYNIPKDHLIFLQFGYMDERKNLENIVRAFNVLPSAQAEKSTLLLIGKFKPGFRSTVENIKSGPYQMIVRDEFVSNEEMESSFAQSDVILRMNIRFFGSSGIIGVAAQHNKPVIASNTGVMAEIVEKYRLGMLVNPYAIDEIAAALSRFHSVEDSLHIDGSKYRNNHDLATFGKTLLQH
jgi:glycosyltransferase involved in cell wall biosynthesis